MKKAIKNISRDVSNTVRTIVPGNTFLDDLAAPAIGFAIGGPVGAAVGSGVDTTGQTGSLMAGIGAGVGSYAGGSFGAPYGSAVQANIGSQIYNTTTGALAGSYLGSKIGSSVGGSVSAPKYDKSGNLVTSGSILPNTEDTFKPTRETESALPSNLSNLSGLTGAQQGSYLASQGVFGKGVGEKEQRYFENLLNRRLVDDSGNVGDFSGIAPVELQYAGQLGYRTDNPSNFLRDVAKRRKLA